MKNNKQLYEKIMDIVSKEINKALDEAYPQSFEDFDDYIGDCPVCGKRLFEYDTFYDNGRVVVECPRCWWHGIKSDLD